MKNNPISASFVNAFPSIIQPFKIPNFEKVNKNSFNLLPCSVINFSFGKMKTNHEPTKKQKYFKIKKFIKYDKVIDEICENKKEPIHHKRRIKKISEKKCYTDEERLNQMKILSKIIRRYRRKVKNLELRFKKKLERSFKNTLNKNRVGNKKDKLTEINITLPNLIKAMRNLRKNKNAEYNTDFKVIEDLITLISTKKLKPDSIHFKKICTLVRLSLGNDKIKHISKKFPLIYLNLPNQKVNITNIERNLYAPVGNEIKVFETIFGIEKENQDDENSISNILTKKDDLILKKSLEEFSHVANLNCLETNNPRNSKIFGHASEFCLLDELLHLNNKKFI